MVGGGAGELDARVRTAAFAFLTEQSARHGDTLPRTLLAQGFVFEGQRVPLLGPQGIFKPAILPEVPLSITTAPIVEGRDRPYDDDFGPHGLLAYRYRGTDPQHRDNVALRLARQRAVPLIYFFGLVPGEYLAVWPVFVVGDDPVALAFTIEVEAKDMPWETAQDGASLVGEGRRRYITQLTRRRLHQESFRWRVLRAYQERCAICRLRHTEERAPVRPESDVYSLSIVLYEIFTAHLPYGVRQGADVLEWSVAHLNAAPTEARRHRPICPRRSRTSSAACSRRCPPSARAWTR